MCCVCVRGGRGREQECAFHTYSQFPYSNDAIVKAAWDLLKCTQTLLKSMQTKEREGIVQTDTERKSQV